MVRFKNRWLLVEFFQPDQHRAASSSTSTSLSDLPILDLLATPDDTQDLENDDDEEDDVDEPWNYPSPPRIPFLAPNQPIFLTSAAQRLATTSSSGSGARVGPSSSAVQGGQGGQATQGGTPGRLIPEKQIYHSLKKTIVDVFGDSGWGKVGNSLSVKYFSQTTSLCIIRVARDHFRTVWGALSFMNRLDGVKVVARVIGCSGTLKKLYKTAEGHTTLIIAQYLAHALDQLPPSSADTTSTQTTGTAGEKTTSTKETMMTTTTREDKVRQGEVDAWKTRRVEVVKALRAVDEG